MNQPVAFITGGGQGIGRAVAFRFAAGGYRVFIQGDVADAQEVSDSFAKVKRDFNRLDVLICNAGISVHFGTPPEELAIEDFDRVIQVNLRGSFLCAQHGIPLLRKQGGAIIFMASTRALMSEAYTEAYSASKGGLLALTHALAVSLTGSGIRVNAISPGWIATDEWKKSSVRRETVLTDHEHRQHPAGRVGKPEDIAEACWFLSQPAAGFITGTNLVIDGGMTIKMIYE